MACTRSVSHAFCFVSAGGTGEGRFRFTFHANLASSTAGYGIAAILSGSISCIRLRVTAAEAKKADGASWAALRIPIPPELIGR